MSKLFVNIALSLDGYMAPEGMTMEHWDTPEYKSWGAKWGALMRWISNQQYFRENLKLGPGGETGPVNDMLRNTTERIGANIMGKRMFEQGERAWPEEAPFHTPVYVLTRAKREPWVRPGATTFHFINDGPERALDLARESAGGRDIRIAGGADVIQQYLNMGVVDELEIALAPVLFGGGRRLFENLREPGPQFRIDRVVDGPAATHLRYVRQQGRHKHGLSATSMNTAELLKVLEVYFEAFAEHDPIRRGELLVQCLTPDCAICGHSHVYAGHAAISEKIALFHTNFPDCRLVLASGLMTFDNIVRAANAIVRRDGSVVARGESVSEIAPDGRLCRIVPLWETSLPLIPESWPAHLAVQPLPKVPDAA